MIWGEIVNSVRTLHYGLIKEFNVSPKLITSDIALSDLDFFPYPKEIDDFDEWEEFIPNAELEDVLPLHSVERVLLEGPILPIQKIDIQSKLEVESLFRSILKLEKEWCQKTRVLTPMVEYFLEVTCANQVLKISTRLGFNRMSSV